MYKFFYSVLVLISFSFNAYSKPKEDLTYFMMANYPDLDIINGYLKMDIDRDGSNDTLAIAKKNNSLFIIGFMSSLNNFSLKDITDLKTSNNQVKCDLPLKNYKLKEGYGNTTLVRIHRENCLSLFFTWNKYKNTFVLDEFKPKN